jgi:uncharacterized protein YbcI
MHEQSPTGLQGGALYAAISSAVVRIQRDYLGRGPTSARTHLNENTLIVELQETLTKAERTLAEQGEGEHVITTRHKFQEAMKSDLVGAVEDLTGREVVAFMSANHLDPDCAAEIFIFRPEHAGASTGAASRPALLTDAS